MNDKQRHEARQHLRVYRNGQEVKDAESIAEAMRLLEWPLDIMIKHT